MKTDIEISRESIKKDIKEIAKKINICEDNLECYGEFKAKINLDKNSLNKKGKLILVTSISPTPFGEGKTTISIGLNDALVKLGKNSIVVLREPSKGPVFGVKGGATGGGYSQVVPMEDINLHFTGDIHAIESANNLLCAIIDNHIYQGNSLHFDKVLFNRCVDLNDRALRNVVINYSDSNLERTEHFNITVASEIMAILCLSKDIVDLKNRIGNILVGISKEGKMIFARNLNCVDAVTILLKDAIKPNLVQTLENNPALIHGGPFANIAHGCNSLIATTLGLNLSDYVVTEAGFGADLGAEKFFDIKCQIGNLKPNCVVLNATIKSIKYNGGLDKSNINCENIEALKKGIVNLERHIENIKKFTKNIVVVLNKFESDTEDEINFVKDFVTHKCVSFEISLSHKMGSEGSIDLAKKVIEICDREVDFKPLYNMENSIIEKIDKVSKEIYRANNVIISDFLKEKISTFEKNGFGNLPICIAKVQSSFTGDSKILGAPTNFDLKVTDIKLSSGAGFIVVLIGNIMTMPGLGKNSAYLNMSIDELGKIEGVF